MSDIKKNSTFLIHIKDLGSITVPFCNYQPRVGMGKKTREDKETNVLSINSGLICHDTT